MPWTDQQLYVDGLIEEFAMGDQEQELEAPTRVIDVDEDGLDALAEFGLHPQAV